MLLASNLVQLYSNPLEGRRQEAFRIAKRWDALDAGSINYGLSVGCGGEAEQVIAWMAKLSDLRWFAILPLGGKAGYTPGGIDSLKPRAIVQNLKALMQIFTHNVTLIVPTHDRTGNRPYPRHYLKESAIRDQRGWIIDTWNLNTKPEKKLISVEAFLFKYGSGIL